MKALGQWSAVFFQPSALGVIALAPGDEWVTEPVSDAEVELSLSWEAPAGRTCTNE